MRLRERLISADGLAVAILIVLWLLFFWRLFTPVDSDQASLVDGDFSGQFVAFGAYQYRRFAAGEIPLWNPYNNGGLPFIADTQAAVFYPPRLATIALSKLAGGWTYHALELEMTAHVLAYSLLMYALVRRLTRDHVGSVFGAFVAAVVASYGGFLSSYPPLQLAILEAAIWLPLAVWGVLEATRGECVRFRWLALTGLALGLSWMAGHPQTSLFLTYLLVAYLGWRTYEQKRRWTVFVQGTLLFGVIAAGVAAVQLLPGLEYLGHTTRAGLGFDAKGNGLLFQDIVQFIFPGIIGPWSPLYVGIVGLALAVFAIWRRAPGALFWGIVALVGLAVSVGANSAVYHALYNLAPGMRFLRGQERAAFLVANSLAILAGLGAAHLSTWDRLQDFKATRRVQQGLLVLTIVCALFTAGVFISLVESPEVYTQRVSAMAFSTLMACSALLAIPWAMANPAQRIRLWALAGLVVSSCFGQHGQRQLRSDLPGQQLAASPLLEPILADHADFPFRVDGFRGLHDNYGSLYQIMDMRGISPLFLDGPYQLIEPDHINPAAWELFAVRYVFSDWNELPAPSEIIASGEDRYGAVKLHRLTNPRPFALLLYDVKVVEADSAARESAKNPDLDLRTTVILARDPGIRPSQESALTGSARAVEFQPEHFTIQVGAPQAAVLSVAHPDYPGWQALADASRPRSCGLMARCRRSWPGYEHTVRLFYDPVVPPRRAVQPVDLERAGYPGSDRAASSGQLIEAHQPYSNYRRPNVCIRVTRCKTGFPV
jgi:hypothetical protein